MVGRITCSLLRSSKEYMNLQQINQTPVHDGKLRDRIFFHNFDVAAIRQVFVVLVQASCVGVRVFTQKTSKYLWLVSHRGSVAWYVS